MTGQLILTCLVVAGPAAPSAQESIRLRYTPSAGERVQTVSWFEVSSRVTESGGTRDVFWIESAGLRGLSHRVIEAQGQQRVLEVVWDSMRVRTRPQDGAWTVTVDTMGPRTLARLTLDDRMRVTAAQLRAEGVAGVARLATLRTFASGLEFALPEDRVVVGQQWMSDVVLPFDLPTGLEQDPQIGPWLPQIVDILARSTFTLDSLVDRGADTLAFLSVHGSFLPMAIASVESLAAGRARVNGAFGGQLIWSTGWSAFVSGALRTRLRMATFVGTPRDEVQQLSLHVDGTRRFQVRR